MYYAEKIINGTLHYRFSPNEGWNEASKEQLTRRVRKAESKLRELSKLLEQMYKIIGTQD